MSVNGNQRTPPNKTSNRTADELVSPISTDNMATFLGLSLPLSVSDDCLIEGLLLSACQMYIDYSSNELLTRTYTFKSDRYPVRQESFSGLGATPSSQDWWVSFQMWPVSVINSVTVNEILLTVTDEYTFDLDGKPSRLNLSDSIINDLVVSYDAGYATAADVPKMVITGIQLLTAYLYEHRGACAVDNPIIESGANMLWSRERMIMSL